MQFYLKIFATISILVAYYMLKHKSTNLVCREDIAQETIVCRPFCDHGYFSLTGMDSCLRWINCTDVTRMRRIKFLGQGAVKQVYLSEVNNFNVVINILRNNNLREDFQHGIKMLQIKQPHEEYVQLIGWCDDVYVTEYHPLGSAENLENILKLEIFKGHNSAIGRLKICLSYVKAIQALHSPPTRMMCDSNDPYKTLSQFLVTSDLDLILNDLDALPEVDSGRNLTSKCGHKELLGEYVAPEQLWPFDDEFDDNLMPGYDEKTDIWKIPSVCNAILGSKASSVSFHLLDIHSKCKLYNRRDRPTASQVVDAYEEIYKRLLDIEQNKSI